VVAHVDGVDDGIAAEFRQRGGVANRKARRERERGAADGSDAAVVLEKVVAGRVLLATVVEDAEATAVRGDGQSGLPLIGSRYVVVDFLRRAPSGAAVGGLGEEHVGLVRSGTFVV